jgi:hypothetical protein
MTMDEQVQVIQPAGRDLDGAGGGVDGGGEPGYRLLLQHGDALGDQILVGMQDVVAGHAEGMPATPTSSIGSPSLGPVGVARRNANDRPIPPAGLLAEAVQHL